MTNGSPRRDPLCAAAWNYMDSSAASGRPPAADAEVLKHIEECPECVREFSQRAKLAEGLKRAVQSQPESPFLEARIRRAIREQESRGPAAWVRSWQPAAALALLLLCLGVVTSYHFGHLRLTRASQDAYISAISSKVAGILSVGLKDHVHCTVFRKLSKQPPSAATMLDSLGPQYGGLLAAVRDRIPQDYKVVMAHRCSYGGRKFVHVAMTGGSDLLSLVIARRSPGESFEASGLKQALTEPGSPIYRGEVQRFAIAGFETRDHLVYLVSDLGEQQNLNLLASLAQPVRTVLSNVEPG